jgi:iron complex outermembrane receptor protein
VEIRGVNKRIDNLQDVPASATVLGREQIRDARIDSLEQLQAFVPNFRVSDSGGRGSRGSVAIRGFFNTDFSKDPSVGVYIDDVPYGDLSTYSAVLFDMTSIEVLRGPQSTLYGANTPAGVINITTALPPSRFGGQAEAELGNRGAREFKARLGGPIGPTGLSWSLAAATDRRDGFITNAFTGQPYNDERTDAWRAKLRWTPGERWDVQAMALQRDIADRGGPYHYVPLDTAAYEAAISGAPRLPADAVWLNRPGAVGQKESTGALKAVYSGPGASVHVVASHRKSRTTGDFDFDDSAAPVDAGVLFGLPPGALVAPGLGGAFVADYRQRTLELRVQSPGDAAPWQWLLGAYTSREQEIGDARLAVEPGAPSPFLDLFYAGRNTALFGQVSWRSADQRLGFSAGTRLDRARRQARSAANGIDGEQHSQRWLPRVTADWRLSSTAMVYANAARGWKPAGVVPEVPPGLPSTYDVEVTDSVEIGTKTEWWGRRLSVNAAVFDASAKGWQDTVRVSPLVRYLANVERTRSRGAELEVQLRPNAAAEMSLTYGFVDARYQRYANPDGTRFDGKRVVQTPRQSLGVAGSWRWANGLSVRADVTRFGGWFYDRENTQAQSGYTMVNAKLAWKQPWGELWLWGENLTNARYFERTFPGNVYRSLNFGSPEDPRGYGVGASVSF